MARAKSGEKRQAILDAAVAVFAGRGFWSTPTSAVSKAAGVAEGTLFTYFATKDELLAELYLSLKGRMAEAMMTGYPAGKPLQEQLRFLWTRYLDWGMQHPEERKVAIQLRLSAAVTPNLLERGEDGFEAAHRDVERAVKDGVLRRLPMEYLVDLFDSLADATLRAMADSPRRAREFRDQGFDVFWNGILAR